MVTGGAGFIGSNLTWRLAGRGAKVTVVDNLSTGRLENLAGLEKRIGFIEGDIRDPELVRRAMLGADVVFHEAARASVQWSVEHPVETNSNNVEGTLNVLTAAREVGVRRVVFASSSSVYGELDIEPKTEDLPADPRSPYAVSKYVGELYGTVFSRVLGLEVVSLRYFNVFGPRQAEDSPYSGVIPRFILAMLQGQRPVIFGDGGHSRDFVYVDDVVDANLLAAEAQGEGVVGEVFNIGSGHSYTLNQLVSRLNRTLGTDIAPVHGIPRLGDVRHSVTSISKARRILGYEPAVPFEEGLRRTAQWFMERGVLEVAGTSTQAGVRGR